MVFGAERKGVRSLTLPCGQCIGCRLVRVRSWAIRCMHEASQHEVSSFVTLTYDQEHFDPSLNYRDFQKFMYRVRTRLGPTRFFMCGEYGEHTQRPHFHALLFGRSFRDGVTCGKDIYCSQTLTALWPHGFSSFGAVTYQSAAYVARYATKKITGPLAAAHYSRVDTRTGECVTVTPEFARMSLRPGIGASWFAKYWREVYVPRDGVVRPGGKQVPPPRYYDKLLDDLNYQLKEEKDYTRYLQSIQHDSDNTPERLAVREHVARAALAFKRRQL